METIRLVIPPVKTMPSEAPKACRHCGHWRLHRHGVVAKRVRDHQVATVVAIRYRCPGCGRTFRHYPDGVSRQDQSERTIVLRTLLWGLGLSVRATALILGAFGIGLKRMSVWRDVQRVGMALRGRRPAGTVRVIGVDETVYRVRGDAVLVGVVVDGQSGQTLGTQVLYAGDAAAFRAWLAPYARALGVEVVVSDDHAAYGVVTEDLGLDHQLCLAHVRKAVTKRTRAIQEQARTEWRGRDRAALTQLTADLARVRELVRELPETGSDDVGEILRRYQECPPPAAGETASVGYRMRMLVLAVWERWHKLRLYLHRPELGLDGTNNASERAIGKSKVRYRTTRGYTSLEGMLNGIALTQVLYRGGALRDLASMIGA